MTPNTPPSSPVARRCLRLGALLALGLSAGALAQSGAPIKVGMSAPFSGNAANLGSEYYRGAQAYLSEVNARGGVNGHPVQLIALDDVYKPDLTLKNTIRLLDQDKVFTLFNYVGSSNITAALPIIKSRQTQSLAVLGILSGAQVQRQAPYTDDAFNVRASYRQEMAAMVDQLWAAGVRKFGLFYQEDAYGRSGADGVARALAAHGAAVSVEATYRRTATIDTNMTPAVQHLKAQGVDVVMCACLAQAAAAFVRDARDAGWTVPVTNLSFVDTGNLLDLLKTAGAKSGKDYATGLVNTQITPSYDDPGLPGAREYRALMDKWNSPLPKGLANSAYTVQRYSNVGFEGFLNAKVLVQALRDAGQNPTRARYLSALSGLKHLDLGIGSPLSFGASNQGLNQVYFSALQNGRWSQVKSLTGVLSK